MTLLNSPFGAVAPKVPVLGPTTLLDFARTGAPRAAEWADDFMLVRERVGAAELGRLFRAVKRGELSLVRPGVYLPASLWVELDVDSRFLARVRAEALAARTPLVFGVESAAALWRLPMIGPWPARPAAFAPQVTGGRSSRALERRCEGIPDEVWVVDGLATTGLARAVVDVARFDTFGVAVTVADRALAAKFGRSDDALAGRVTKAELMAVLEELTLARGDKRVTAVIEFADGSSGSAGESISRVSIHRLGFPPPILQFEFRDAAGRMIVDFWWPEFKLIGEFDGKGKYLRDEFTGGRSTAEVVLAEKGREDRLRAQGPTMCRWGWEHAMVPPKLCRQLLAAGLPVAR